MACPYQGVPGCQSEFADELPLRPKVKLQSPSTSLRAGSPLRFAPPDFLLRLVALASFMLLSVTKAAHAAVSGDAWQEIRVRSG